MKDYPLPDPKVNPIAAIVLSYKTWKSVLHDNREWDKANWARASKASKLLLDICQGFDQSERCLGQLAQQFNDAELAWTLETITKHAHDWMQKNGRGSGTNARKRLFDAIAKRRAEERTTSQGELATGGEILAGIRDLQIVQHETFPDKTGTRRGHIQMPRAVEGNPGQRQSGNKSDEPTEGSSMGVMGA